MPLHRAVLENTLGSNAVVFYAVSTQVGMLRSGPSGDVCDPGQVLDVCRRQEDTAYAELLETGS